MEPARRSAAAPIEIDLPDAGQSVLTPLTGEEELRARAAFLDHLTTELGRAAEVRFPAYTPEERLRLHALAEPLSVRLGTPVRAETRDVTAVWFVRAV
ncbi:hypothetical protein ACH4TS_28250 [Streptomyces albidoflavus]